MFDQCSLGSDVNEVNETKTSTEKIMNTEGRNQERFNRKDPLFIFPRIQNGINRIRHGNRSCKRRGYGSEKNHDNAGFHEQLYIASFPVCDLCSFFQMYGTCDKIKLLFNGDYIISSLVFDSIIFSKILDPPNFRSLIRSISYLVIENL